MEINGIEYTIGRLNAVDQFHVSRKIAPIVPKLMPIIAEIAKGDLAKVIESIDGGESGDLSDLQPLADALSPLMEAIAQMPDEDVNYLIFKCLSVAKRGGAVVCRNNTIMFDDIDMTQLLPLVIATIRVNLGNFIQGLLMKASSMQKQPQ
ncbi:phage tail assembly chaperone [Acinetobacter baumannii]|uniref:phage tail assembly chaperone n=1 Tax=Acinetobacter baumannii TaxID=470 RepID=UPI0037BF7379